MLSKADTRYVACADPAERERVRKSFLEKKLGLSGDDLDAAIEAACAAMKADRTKSRLTFYYLLAERYGKLGSRGVTDTVEEKLRRVRVRSPSASNFCGRGSLFQLAMQLR